MPSFTADELSGCKPHKVNFISEGVGGNSTCLWDFGDGNTSTSCNQTSHIYTSSGFYTVTLTVTDETGCVGTYVETDYIEVIPSPIADFSASPMVANTFDSEVDFTNTSENADSYTWTFGDGTPESHAEHPTHVFPDEEGSNYIVTLVATDEDSGCSDT